MIGRVARHWQEVGRKAKKRQTKGEQWEQEREVEKLERFVVALGFLPEARRKFFARSAQGRKDMWYALDAVVVTAVMAMVCGADGIMGSNLHQSAISGFRSASLPLTVGAVLFFGCLCVSSGCHVSASPCAGGGWPGVDGGLQCGLPFSVESHDGNPGRFGVRAFAYVTVDLAGVVRTDAEARILVLLGATKKTTQGGSGIPLSLSVQICDVRFPEIPIPGQANPTTIDLSDQVYVQLSEQRVGALLDDESTCSNLGTNRATFLFGVRLDDPTGDVLPVWPEARTCVDDQDTNCLFDGDGDGEPGVTLHTQDMPLLNVTELHVAMRTSVGLQGMVSSPDRLLGGIDLTMDLSIVGCRILDQGTLKDCSPDEVDVMAGLHPTIVQLAEPESPYAGIRVADDVDCVDLVAREAALFGH